MHRFFAQLDPSLTVTEQNLVDRVRYILRFYIFGDTELEPLRRKAVSSLDENAAHGTATQLIAEQPAHLDVAVNISVVVDSDDDGIVSYEVEQMKSILKEAISETRTTSLENRPRLSRIAL
ncbi:unnamed protein product [Parnassius apollo]|uniref:(apollo) hypothetical protein n=1 Tax=Parnassius apollo TaxID=110799 RepID=A0A8S3WSJ0_PARAO|nr:unnamed protein product [Parnassius apollo]